MLQSLTDNNIIVTAIAYHNNMLIIHFIIIKNVS